MRVHRNMRVVTEIDSLPGQAYGIAHMSGYHLSQSTHTWWWSWDAPEVASSG